MLEHMGAISANKAVYGTEINAFFNPNLIQQFVLHAQQLIS